jgi:site-specific recombinase XerD
MPKKPSDVNCRGSRWYDRFRVDGKVYQSEGFDKAADLARWVSETRRTVEQGFAQNAAKVPGGGLIDRFIAERDTLGLHGCSVATYRHTLGLVRRFFEGKKAVALTPLATSEYRLPLARTYPNPRTDNYHLSTFKIFCRWLANNGILQRDPTTAIKPVRDTAPSHPREVFTADQITGLLEDQETPLRTRAAIGLSALAGLRISEVAGMR